MESPAKEGICSAVEKAAEKDDIDEVGSASVNYA
jgi:hypothetical protein